MNVISEVTEILNLLYKHNWDERNGGNLSYILTENEVKTVCNPNKIIRSFEYDFDMDKIEYKLLVFPYDNCSCIDIVYIE